MKDNQNRQEVNATSSETSIHTDFKNNMTYGEYLQLDKILSAQSRLSGHHDEVLFIVIHQVSELWMKLILHEMHAAIDCITKDDLSSAFKKLARVSKTQSQIIQAWDVLSTMTPSEYMEFRDSLGQASGFQSYQYRMIEFALGYKTPHVLKIYEKDPKLLKELRQAYEAPGLYDVAIQALNKAGISIDEEVLNRDVTRTYQENESVRKAWITVYKNPQRYWDLYELAEKLVDIEDWLQQWRFRHMKTVERVIGFKRGTGGSSGVGYLKKVLEQRFFPELWDLRTEL
ncbi:Tryptophan 2,3-dioxygenase apoenzyme [Fictibacillus enclensis]|uniref:Tryptophan 2,3-dioxygenase n=1 Tax=Fictibacillus enclensis TaxID=1017270 RepID=A0A0V8IZW0_9BACL|nr:tryptophan 2,3-dioxygenase [Fictibacillus enclensis]KSU80249.1 tryptophan 2,3-dioxygenase [Fictibacillus enclensis]SCC37155.1 Tryptophan 2,3-dioxygenase apoenzyme [Fictibacillus enclensis]